MAKYLIHHNHKGRTIEVPLGTPSEEYGRLQENFAKEAGKDPRQAEDWQYAEMIQLDEHQKCEGVYYEWGLAGPGGAWFDLIAFRDTTPQQLEVAKSNLRRTRDVVRMSVTHIKEMI